MRDETWMGNSHVWDVKILGLWSISWQVMQKGSSFSDGGRV
jgi:hypothetical protein